MEGWRLVVVGIACIIVGGAIGFGVGWVIWKLGFELIGSSVALAGAALGGVLTFLWFMNKRDSY